MNSIHDHADTKAKSFPKKSIFYVTVDSLNRILNMNVFLSDTRHIYKDKDAFTEYPIKESILEVDGNLYHFNKDMGYEKLDFSILVDYNFIEFNKNLSTYEVFYLEDDLKFIMKYSYCLDNPEQNLKVYSNNRKKFNKAFKEFTCVGNK
ncbi:hypothetical protein [Yeosuana sp.]|uniref:hypothetical protein n=1 Tax=Yeosuana sp. TaxID=2529388 RepID=UPI004054EAED